MSSKQSQQTSNDFKNNASVAGTGKFNKRLQNNNNTEVGQSVGGSDPANNHTFEGAEAASMVSPSSNGSFDREDSSLSAKKDAKKTSSDKSTSLASSNTSTPALQGKLEPSVMNSTTTGSIDFHRQHSENLPEPQETSENIQTLASQTFYG